MGYILWIFVKRAILSPGERIQNMRMESVGKGLDYVLYWLEAGATNLMYNLTHSSSGLQLWRKPVREQTLPGKGPLNR